MVLAHHVVGEDAGAGAEVEGGQQHEGVVLRSEGGRGNLINLTYCILHIAYCILLLQPYCIFLAFFSHIFTYGVAIRSISCFSVLFVVVVVVLTIKKIGAI